MLTHILILCGRDKVVYDYFIKWIAHAIQFPEQKCGVAPVFISGEGAGKGSLISLLRKMLGERKVLETTSPERDVWGQFNPQMVDSFIININEVSKKNLQDSYGRIKALITDASLTVNMKGLSQFETKSYHRFVLTTNNEEPINTASGDRRFFVVRSSDELIGNKAYFTRFNELLESVSLVKHCYEYFKNLEGVKGFIKWLCPKLHAVALSLRVSLC
jgi:putative DNA primase/helicase